MGDQAIRPQENREHERKFMGSILRDIQALELMLKKGMIEEGVRRIGAEQEVCLLKRDWHPAMQGPELIRQLADPHLAPELARFNLELNLDPQLLEGKGFSTMGKQLDALLSKVEKAAGDMGTKVIMTGILPTIRLQDLAWEHMTPSPRFKILADRIQAFRGKDFEFYIQGIDQLITRHGNILYEACNTSFQVHLQVDPGDFVTKYNWAQAISGPVLAAAANSPLLLGKRLWHETRVALFEQAVDMRSGENVMRQKDARVSFGHGWLQNSIVELFRDDIARHELIISADLPPDSLEILEKGEIPRLKALMLHNGTLYKWNRPCYGITDGVPHLRIECRYLPAGPTSLDEMANAALWVGLMQATGTDGYASHIDREMDFDIAKANFITGAREGLGAQFHWPGRGLIPARQLLLEELLPMARGGLERSGVDRAEIDKYLGVIQARVEKGKNGATWLIDNYTRLLKKARPQEAMLAVTAGAWLRQSYGQPVHTWDEARLQDTGDCRSRYAQVSEVMSTDLITVREDDPVRLVSRIMDWRHIHHVPVESEQGKLIGIISAGLLVQHMAEGTDAGEQKVGDIMVRDPMTIAPETSTREALRKMAELKIGCLPVVNEGRLVGILTGSDGVRLAHRLFEELDDSA